MAVMKSRNGAAASSASWMVSDSPIASRWSSIQVSLSRPSASAISTPVMTSPLPNRRWAVAVEVYPTAPWKPRPAPSALEDARDRDDLAAARRRQRDRVARRQVEVVRDPAGEDDLVRLWRGQRPLEQVERSEVLGAIEVGPDHVQDVVSGDDGRSRPLRHGPGGAAERHRADGRLDPVEGGHLVDEGGCEGGVEGPDRPDEHVDVPGRPRHRVVEGCRGRGAGEQHGVEHGHPERRARTRQREPRRSPAQAPHGELGERPHRSDLVVPGRRSSIVTGCRAGGVAVLQPAEHHRVTGPRGWGPRPRGRCSDRRRRGTPGRRRRAGGAPAAHDRPCAGRA